jgi:hypothetical protein
VCSKKNYGEAGARAIKVGYKQTIETLINEEASIFAMYLRNEQKVWKPKIDIAC